MKLTFTPRRPVQRPGVRGGRFHYGDEGQVIYGDFHAPLSLPPATLHDIEIGTPRGYRAMQAACYQLLEEHTHLTLASRGISWESVRHRAQATIHKALHTLDLRHIVHSLRAAGRKHGPAFMAYAVGLVVLKDLLVPAFLTAIGHPGLIPIVLAVRSEPVAYPLYFAVRHALGGGS